MGSLAYDVQNDKVRVKTSTGWADVQSALVDDGGGGTGSGLLTRANKRMTALATTADNQLACSVALTETPAAGCYVGVRLNGVDVLAIGDGTKLNSDCYFSADGGATARAWSAITVGDALYWRGSYAGYQLSTSDVIEFVYEQE